MTRNVLLHLGLPFILLASCAGAPEETSFIKEENPFTHTAKGKIKSTTIYIYPNNDTTGKYDHAIHTVYNHEGKPVIINDTLPANRLTINRHIEYRQDKISGWKTTGKNGGLTNTASISWKDEYNYTVTQVNKHNFINYKQTVSLNNNLAQANINETFFDSSGIIYDAYRTYKYNNEGNVTACTYEKGIHEGSSSRFTINDIDSRGNITLLTESSGDGLINRSIRIHYEYYE